MYLIPKVGYFQMDNFVIWIVGGIGLFLASPAIVGLLKGVINGITDVIGNLLYTILSPLLNQTINKTNKKEVTTDVVYNIQKEERQYTLKNHKGEYILPVFDRTVDRYRKANVLYPEPGSRADKNAKKLNLDYFVNENYPYDYVVLGHRAAIEEARKGSRLTGEEEVLIWLGYGYDGRPFGEPWGLEEEMFNDYLYAEKQGDFLEWFHKIDKFENYINAGYEAPIDQHDTVNRDMRDSADYYMRRYDNDSKRLTKERFRLFQQKEKTSRSNVSPITPKV